MVGYGYREEGKGKGEEKGRSRGKKGAEEKRRRQGSHLWECAVLLEKPKSFMTTEPQIQKWRCDV